MYEYKTVSMPKHLVFDSGDLGTAIAEYVENTVNKMSQEGWEFYRADEYSVAESPGCLMSLFGQKEQYENYNVLVFRRNK